MAVAIRTLDNFIGGLWTPSTGETVREIVSPVSGDTIADAPNASSDDIDRAVAAFAAVGKELGVIS